jgi:glycosyltransferase involved in cell wall biosynthesis
MSAPAVSVIIPCYNQGRFLDEALRSVVAQTLPATEIVVVDDGSTDDTAAVARAYAQVRYVRQRNRGLASARNLGLAHSTGAYIVFVDADDRLRPEALAIGVRELAAHPPCAFVWGYCVRIDEHGRQLPTVPPPPVVGDPYEALLRNNFIWTPAVVMFRRSMCAPLMRFSPGVDPSADYELYLRIVRHFPIHGHSAVVADYRLHGASMSRNAARMLRSTMDVLDAQRPYIRDRGRYRRAFEQGQRSWQGHYGEQLIEQLATQLRKPERWIQAGTMLAVLARYYPRGLAFHVVRTVWQTLSRPRSPGARSAVRLPASASTDEEDGVRAPARDGRITAGRCAGG